MSLLAQQVAALTKAYHPPVPQGYGRVHVIADDPDEEIMPEAPKPKTSRRDIKWIRDSILRAVENAESPLSIPEISDKTKLKWDRCRKSVDRLVEQGKLERIGAPRKYRYTIAREANK